MQRIYSYISLATLVASGLVVAALAMAEDKDASDWTAPQKWKKSVDDIDASKDRLVVDLIKIAQDPKQYSDIRHQAIMTLGAIKTKQSVEFLVENISVRILPLAISADTIEREYPCFYVLKQGGWDVAEVLFEDPINGLATEEDLKRCASVLCGVLGKDLAIVMTDFKLKNDNIPRPQIGLGESYRIKNLKFIKAELALMK